MKVWRARDIYVGGSEGAMKLTSILNDLEKNGWTVEGIDFFSMKNERVMIIASMEKETSKGKDRWKHQ